MWNQYFFADSIFNHTHQPSSWPKCTYLLLLKYLSRCLDWEGSRVRWFLFPVEQPKCWCIIKKRKCENFSIRSSNDDRSIEQLWDFVTRDSTICVCGWLGSSCSAWWHLKCKCYWENNTQFILVWIVRGKPERKRRDTKQLLLMVSRSGSREISKI